MTFHVPEPYRLTLGDFGTTIDFGNNGCFVLPSPISTRRKLLAFSSDGLEWEHVSISARIGRNGIETPYWDEMQYIKNLFWDQDDIVMQLHPAQKNYVNTAPNVLHLWRPIGKEIPIPPVVMV